MCGIFGYWNYNGKPVDLAAAQQATTLLRHRGPDDEGYLLVNTQTSRTVLCGGPDTNPALNLPLINSFANETFDLVLGFRRLAILDLSPAGHQPMASRDGRFWIIFNGEIYNYLELRAELGRYGYEFQTGTDTEVILAAYQHWGDSCLAHFNGMWAFALWDHHEQRLFAARDRFGIKPLHYIRDNNRFIIASEIKALIGPHGVLFEPDDQVIYRYLAGGVLPSPQQELTFFKGVKSLAPGHQLILHRGTLSKQRYWTLPTTTSDFSTPNATEIVARYRELFLDSVRLRLRADVPIGTCLSGGLDSSAIVCAVNHLMNQEGLTKEQIGQQQKTFSAVYSTSGRYNERPHIERLLQAASARGHFAFPTGPQLRQEAERLIWYQDEPFQTTSIFAQWCVMKEVHEQGVTVLLDGQGADEVLAGYRPFTQFLGDLIHQAKLWQALKEAQAMQKQTGLSKFSLLLRALAWQIPGYWAEVLRRQVVARHADVSLFNPDFIVQRHQETIADWWPWRDHCTLDGHLQTLLQESNLPHLLRHEDRNSMAFSVEARVPHLDYRLVQFAFGEASHWRIHEGWTKWVLRQAMTGMVPAEIAWRKDKVGFETPEAEWLGEWLNMEPNLFNDEALSGQYLNLNRVRDKLCLWLKTGGSTEPIWRWINLELWLRVFQGK